MALVLSLAGLVTFDAAARAADCPASGNEAVEAALRAAPTCDAAMTLFTACGTGSSPDVVFGEIVIAKCEAAFLARLNASRRKAYQRAQDVCIDKNAGESGTLFRAMRFICLAQLSQTYAHRYAAKARATRK